jgi:hypothetical protein
MVGPPLTDAHMIVLAVAAIGPLTALWLIASGKWK